MKKILLVLAMTLVSIASASAISLQEAFSALSNLPNVSVKENLDLQDLTNNKCPIRLDSLKIAQVSIGYDLDAEKIAATGNGAYAILNQIPLQYMINGANNNNVCAFLYSTPCEGQPGMNHLLIAVMSGQWGTVCFVDAIVGDKERDAIQFASIEMKGDYLNMAIPDYFNITINNGSGSNPMGEKTQFRTAKRDS